MKTFPIFQWIISLFQINFYFPIMKKIFNKKKTIFNYKRYALNQINPKKKFFPLKKYCNHEKKFEITLKLWLRKKVNVWRVNWIFIDCLYLLFRTIIVELLQKKKYVDSSRVIFFSMRHFVFFIFFIYIFIGAKVLDICKCRINETEFVKHENRVHSLSEEYIYIYV